MNKFVSVKPFLKYLALGSLHCLIQSHWMEGFNLILKDKPGQKHYVHINFPFIERVTGLCDVSS